MTPILEAAKLVVLRMMPCNAPSGAGVAVYSTTYNQLVREYVNAYGNSFTEWALHTEVLNLLAKIGQSGFGMFP